jgi:endonuclease/exonuclease/phosphatase family metal-dependent hydrolase
MRRMFVEQMQGGQNVMLPQHVPLLQQVSSEEDTSHIVLRVLQWNLNCLCGPDGRAAQCVQPILDIIDSCCADVILFQEAPASQEGLVEPWYSHFPEQGMRALENGLRYRGYSVQLRTQDTTSSLLCSKLELDRVINAISLDEDHEFRPVMDEERVSLLADFRLPGTANSQGYPVVSIYATHMYHDNHTTGSDGVRQAEAKKLLSHWRSNASSRSKCAVVATDFNQARRVDYSDQEWKVISAGLAKVNQPHDDGVADLLQRAGWTCAYDAPLASRNWSRAGAPPLTHWTGTVVDYPYVAPHTGVVNITGVFMIHSAISDHVPIIMDIAIST